MDNKVNITHIRKVLNTLNELVADRGLPKFNHTFTKDKIEKFLETKKYNFEHENIVFQFIYNNKSDKKYGKALFNKYIKTLSDEDEPDKIIIFVIFWDDLNSKNKYENYYNEEIFSIEKKNIQIFEYKNLVFNLTKHSLVPNHEKIHEKDLIDLQNTLMISNFNQLPVILTNDPVCKYYNFQANDILKITRNSNGNTHLFYRIVKHHSDDLDFSSLNGYE
jgi:DNA-directed RNA polymerase subunit H (RpoH/RPB5)